MSQAGFKLSKLDKTLFKAIKKFRKEGNTIDSWKQGMG